MHQAEHVLMQLALTDLFRARWSAGIHREWIPALELPDADDYHMLTAAIVGRCNVIVMQNRADFPVGVLATLGIEAQHPDEFLINHIRLAPGLFCAAMRKVHARLKNPPVL